MQETINMYGELTLRLLDREGRVVHQQHRKNRIVTGGRRLVARLFGGNLPSETEPSRVTQMAVGEESTPPDDGQTQLGKERARNRINLVEYTELDEQGANGAVRRVRAVLQTELDYGDANDPTKPLREAGIFTDDNVMYNRVVFEPVIKTETFKLMLIWEITF